MKIGIFTDVHWSTTTSILRSKEGNYTTRLNLLVKGMNWANELFERYNCQLAVCAGDFFDKSTCTDEELSALGLIKWTTPTVFIVGNHESTRADLSVSTVAALEKDIELPGCERGSNIISKPTSFSVGSTQIHFLPYIVESDRKPLKDYLVNCNPFFKQIIFSHNDLKDVQYGPYLNTTGFSKSEIEAACDLYLNGHIHNGQWITDKILNLGSMTAHNFTNDSELYKYGVWILDTDTMKIEFHENPYSLSFYKIEITSEQSLLEFDSLKNNAIVSIHCLETLKEKLLEKLDTLTNILVSRVTYYNLPTEDDASGECTLVKSDHLEQFRKYVLESFPASSIVKEELNEICK